MRLDPRFVTLLYFFIQTLFLSGCWYHAEITEIEQTAPVIDYNFVFTKQIHYTNNILNSSYHLTGDCPAGSRNVSVKGDLQINLICDQNQKFDKVIYLGGQPDGVRILHLLSDNQYFQNDIQLINDLGLPTTPQWNTISSWSNSLTQTPILSWQPSTDNHTFSHYEVRLIQDNLNKTVVKSWETLEPNQVLSSINLTEGTSYYLELRALDAANNTSISVQSQNFRPDVHQPTNLSCTEVADATSSKTPDFFCSVDETLSGLNRFEYAIGTSSGGQEILPWTSITHFTQSEILASYYSVTITNATLTWLPNVRYYHTFRAVDNGGNSTSELTRSWVLPVELDQSLSINFKNYTEQPIVIKDSISTKYYLAGNFSATHGTSQTRRLARLNANGTLDSTFNSGGTGFDGPVIKTLVLPDDSILVGGYFSSYNGTPSPYLIKLTSQGAIDSNFHVNNSFDGAVFSLAYDNANQKIYVGGIFSHYNGIPAAKVVRLNSDGTYDSGFNSGTGFVNQYYTCNPYNIYALGDTGIYDIFVQSDGKVIFGGCFTEYNKSPQTYLVRTLSNGTLDTTFASTTPSYAQGIVYKIKSWNAQNVVVSGVNLLDFNNTTHSNSILKINLTNGTFDPSFDGYLNLYAVNGIAVDGSQNVYYHSPDHPFDKKISRLKNDGTLDTTNFKYYSASGYNLSLGFTDQLAHTFGDVVLQSDGKTLYGGGFHSTMDWPTQPISQISGRIIRLNTNGTTDSTFMANSGAGFDNTVTSIALQTSGKIVVGGAFLNYDTNLRHQIVRLNSDLTLDSTFVVPALTQYASSDEKNITTLAVQTDGQLIVGGRFNDYLGNTQPAGLIRFTTTGSIDNTFAQGGGFVGGTTGDVKNVAVDSTNAVYVMGDFDQYDTTTLLPGFVKLTTSGTVNTTYMDNLSMVGTTDLMQIQPSDNKILLYGTYSYINANVNTKKFVRLNTDGSLDTGFNPAVSTNINQIKVAANGKIWVVHDNTQIKKLNSNGTLDTSFSLDTIISSISIVGHFYISLLDNDKVLIFTGPNQNSSLSSIVYRANANGSLDSHFYIPFYMSLNTNYYNQVQNIFPLSNTKYWFIGNLKYYGTQEVSNSFTVTASP